MGAEPWLENDLAHSLTLDGSWQFSLAGEPFREIPVPSAWEAHTPDKITDGPAVYRRAFELAADWLGAGRVVLEFGAVSFDCKVRVNGRLAGEHRGMWSAFQLDVTHSVQPGANTIEVEVFKPGRRFPMRECLAGFLPDVATAFGGIWQGLRLVALEAAISDLRLSLRRQVDGPIQVSGAVAGAQTAGSLLVVTELTDARGAVVRSAQQATLGPNHSFTLSLEAGGLSHWRLFSPTLYTVTVSVLHGGSILTQASRTIGIRDVVSAGGRAQIDGRPLHLRGVLDWGWHPEIIRPAPDRAKILRQFEQARNLGFNLIKLCLFVPDEATFQAADEAGMYLWLEMPLWLPHLTAEVRALALAEYEAVFRRLHHHPSIVVLSLGCELNSEADREFLQSLSALARSYFPNVLHCDNSGSAEAYGGVATAPSDFYDYHFYSDPHFFQPLVEHFDRGYRPARPWLFGEFCDADTARDFSALLPEPWWLTEPVTLDRNDLLYTRDYKPRLAQAGVTDGGAALTSAARRQATAIRKYILEQARLHDATGGYVVTGWVDTPIATSGVVDDQGELKFEPAEWQQFNADAVLLLERERRRTWERGGDRPSYRDPFSWWQDERPELHIVLSNGLGTASGGRLRWALTGPDGAELASDVISVPELPGGEVTELTTIYPSLPQSTLRAPAECRLSVDLDLELPNGGRHGVSNAWSLWAVPRPKLAQLLAIDERLMERHDWRRLDKRAEFIAPKEANRGATRIIENISPAVLNWVAAGGRVVWWVTEPTQGVARGMPFWREAIHTFEPHALWERVPNPGWADMRFFSLATDLALDLGAVQARLGPGADCRPVWRRFDARALTWADYLIEVQFGAGRIWVSTLRFAGGLGRQPAGFATDPWGAWLLAALLNP